MLSPSEVHPPASLPSHHTATRYFISSCLLRVAYSVPQQLSSSCCFVCATDICSSLAHMQCSSCSLSFLISHHIFQNTCRLFSFVLFFFVAWLILLCSRTRYASISLDLPLMNCDCLVSSVSQSLTTYNLYISKMKNQHGHWVYWCRRVKRTV